MTQRWIQLIIAYSLWLFLGFFGAHLFYLRRDRHAFIHFATLGGFFGAGWIRDFFRIPDYLDYSMRNETFNRRRPPDIVPSRILAEILVGYLFGFLLRVFLPEELLNELLVGTVINLLIPYAIATGVHLVANIGEQCGSFKMALLGSYISMPIMLFSHGNFTWLAVASTAAINKWGVDWKPLKQKHRSVCARLTLLVIFSAVYWSMWTSAFICNATVTTEYGEKIPVKDALKNFFTSPLWETTKETMSKINVKFWEEGFDEAWTELRVALDPEGEHNAYRVLGLSSSASEQEISSAFRKLAKRWHPDKQKTEAEKKFAEAEFIRIKQAYETLSTIQNKRMQNKNKVEL